MNFRGYYDAQDIWLPDPVLQQRQAGEAGEYPQGGGGAVLTGAEVASQPGRAADAGEDRSRPGAPPKPLPEQRGNTH